MITNVTEYIEKIAAQYPDKPAIRDSDREVSFLQLTIYAKKLAMLIIGKNILRQPVAVFMPKSSNAVISFLGINYSGNFYVPLDVKSPAERLDSLLRVLDPAIIVTDKEHYASLKTYYDLNVLVFEDIISNDEEADSSLIKKTLGKVIDTDPVYSIFTSGSTGTPKGVVISHRGVIDYIDWAVNSFNIDRETIIGNQAPFYFDNSTLDIYLMYSTGATLVIVPEEMYIFPAKLIDYLNDNVVNFIFWVPFIMITIAKLDIFAVKRPKYLKNIFFAGEVMPNKHLNYWRKHLPECRYVNLYGPTEITVDCTYYVVERQFSDDEPLPIGFPCKNSDIIILNEKGETAKVEEPGELCVRGSSLSLGYYNDWEKTMKTFVQNPLNKHYPECIYRTGDLVCLNKLGEIIFLGRKDSQIKHIGYRIELGEIETAVLGTQMVDVCNVSYDNVNKQIVMFYEAKLELQLSDFRKAMLLKLPKYMLPTLIKRVPQIKCNSNGKIDRLFYNRMANGI